MGRRRNKIKKKISFLLAITMLLSGCNTADEVVRWFDERLFSDEKVINAIGKKIKSE